MKKIIDTILITDQEYFGFDCGGAYAVYIGIGGEPDTYVCVTKGVGYSGATGVADMLKLRNPHMTINEL